MRTRYLPIFFAVVFALTLLFAVAAGAQEERTDFNRVKVTCLMHTTAHIDFLRASGHEHHFAGGGKGTLTQDMTAEELRDSETSCATPSDTALAWFPVIQDPGDSVGGYEEVDRVNFYYDLESLHLMPAFGEIDLATHEGGDLSYGCGRNPVKLDAPPVGCTEGDWRIDADLPGTNVSVVIHYKNSDGVLGANPRVSTDAGFTDYRSMHVDYFATFTPEFVELVEACAQQMPNLADECRTTQQQVPNDQQVQPQPVQIQAQGCRNPDEEVEITDPDTHETGSFDVQGEAIRIRYEIITDNGSDDDLVIEVRDDNDDLVRPIIDVSGDTDGPNTVRESVDPGDDFTFEVDAGDDIEYFVIIEDCRGNDSNNNRNNNNNNRNNNRNNDRNTNNDTIDDTVDVTQDTTTPTTTDTTTTDTADDANLNADFANRPDSGSFRCDLFLRTVRDDRGALRAQYQGDELIVQRFEQCLSEDVLADTIPDRQLPFTGGPSMPFGGGLLLLVAVVVLAGRIIRR